MTLATRSMTIPGVPRGKLHFPDTLAGAGSKLMTLLLIS